ncbi:MAG TPA: bifunctional ADP-heptose synthase [Flavitalea sp.]|nr:bifunctional ADP-heptose synthase [Flavitalea sp.]
MDFKKLFDSFSKLKVAVIGDVMLDTYWWGHVERISPEAPVPVVALDKKEYRIGGAGNVALNLASLGAPVFILSVLGNDEDAGILEPLLRKNNIDTTSLMRSNDRVTTNKSRIISRNQQMMRLDSEITRDLSRADEENLLLKIEKFLDKEKPAVIIFEDYNKGILTESVISETISLCKKRNVLTAADPKRKNFFTYEGVSIFKPNLKEVREGLNLLTEDVSEKMLDTIHTQLHDRLSHDISLITLSEKGVYYHDARSGAIIPSHIRNIADVSGAGDTVIAVASLIYASTQDVFLTASVANIAGGLVCEEVGTVAIRKDALLKECMELL